MMSGSTGIRPSSMRAIRRTTMGIQSTSLELIELICNSEVRGFTTSGSGKAPKPSEAGCGREAISEHSYQHSYQGRFPDMARAVSLYEPPLSRNQTADLYRSPHEKVRPAL